MTQWGGGWGKNRYQRLVQLANYGPPRCRRACVDGRRCLAAAVGRPARANLPSRELNYEHLQEEVLHQSSGRRRGPGPATTQQKRATQVVTRRSVGLRSLTVGVWCWVSGCGAGAARGLWCKYRVHTHTLRERYARTHCEGCTHAHTARTVRTRALRGQYACTHCEDGTHAHTARSGKHAHTVTAVRMHTPGGCTHTNRTHASWGLHSAGKHTHIRGQRTRRGSARSDTNARGNNARYVRTQTQGKAHTKQAKRQTAQQPRGLAPL